MSWMDYIKYAVIALLAWNIVVFFLYGADKSKARKHKQRISEKTLLVTAFFMGGIGAFFGMWVFRHKTKHWKFKILVPLFVILNAAAVATVYYFYVH